MGMNLVRRFCSHWTTGKYIAWDPLPSITVTLHVYPMILSELPSQKKILLEPYIYLMLSI